MVCCEAPHTRLAAPEPAISGEKRTAAMRRKRIAQAVLVAAALAGAASAAHATIYFTASPNDPATDTDASATKTGALAAGIGASADGTRSLAAGLTAQALDDATIAIGAEAIAGGSGSIATGFQALTVQENSIATGTHARATGKGSVAVGATSEAMGDMSTALGFGAHTTGSAAFAGGRSANAASNFAVAIGYEASVDVGSAGSMALGAGALARGGYASAFGAAAAAIANSAVAIGYMATATSIDSVALGARSTTTADPALPGYQPTGNGATDIEAPKAIAEVSIGSAANERRLTNVAAGTAGTDAVNVSQLKAVDGKVEAVAQNGTLHYFKADGTATGSDDAVANGTNAVAAGVSAAATAENAVAVGMSATAGGVGSTALGAYSSVTGAGGVALGYMASASADNSVAIGQGSIADRVNTVSVGSAGNERQIANVAAGTADTDAVNVAQLKAVSDQGAATTAKLDGAVMYDTNEDGSVDNSSITLGDASAGGTVIHNVANGVDATDAVNVSQLNTAISGAVSDIVNHVVINAANPFFSAEGDRDAEGAVSSGAHSLASGASAQATAANAVAIGANAVASATNATALGAAANASATNATAVGAGANASAENSVALGQGSVADRANTVSVGAAGQERQITNVAAGVQGTDAVNVNQLQQSVGGALSQANRYTDDQIRSARRDSYGGTASAMAMAGLPQAVLPGRGMVAMAGGTYAGQSALALGVSQLSETGKWVYKVQGTTDSRGQFGAAVGAGMHW